MAVDKKLWVLVLTHIKKSKRFNDISCSELKAGKDREVVFNAKE